MHEHLLYVVKPKTEWGIHTYLSTSYALQDNLVLWGVWYNTKQQGFWKNYLALVMILKCKEAFLFRGELWIRRETTAHYEKRKHAREDWKWKDKGNETKVNTGAYWNCQGTHMHTNTHKEMESICLQWCQLETSGAKTLQVKRSDMLSEAWMGRCAHVALHAKWC